MSAPAIRATTPKREPRSRRRSGGKEAGMFMLNAGTSAPLDVTSNKSTKKKHSKHDNPSSTQKAPIELLGQFLACVMRKQFEEAENLCAEILKIEPNNETVQEFLPVIREKIELDEQNNSESSSEDDETDEDEGVDQDKSGSSSNSDSDTDEEEDRAEGYEASGVLLRPIESVEERTQQTLKIFRI
eukprot:m.72692 g.72692  ORF g.72692 m.72692 type:complete len:186 (+) comp12348_c0_seq2:463-1020(+)